MKIQCDVCNQSEASVYCSADEAALCSACDHRVHHANKLAGKHHRFSLLIPSPKDAPLCDICQEKKALLFCQQDRAILCKDCDVAIHKVNQHTQTHNRFLLTGVKLSPTATLYSSPTPPASSRNEQKLVSDPPIMSHGSAKSTNGSGQDSTTSSISEYLIDMLPGWHVEDFLDPTPDFSKKLQVGVNDPGPIWGYDLQDGSLNTSFSPESMAIWVPQAPPPPAAALPPNSQYAHVLQPYDYESGSNIGFANGSSIVFGQSNYNSVKKNTSGSKSSRNWVSDYGNCFTVPQISPSSTSSKRSRTLWQ